MAHKKTQIVAKSIAKKFYVSGCPIETSFGASNQYGYRYYFDCEEGKRNY